MEQDDQVPPVPDSHQEDLESQVFPLRSMKKQPKTNVRGVCYTALTTVILTLGLIALITWLALRPIHSPTYTTTAMHVPTFTLTTTATNSSSLDARFDFNVTATNANHKVGFKYDWITIDVSYSGQNFGRATVNGFTQAKRIPTMTKSTSLTLTNVTLPLAIATPMANDVQLGIVAMRADARAKIHARVGSYLSFPVAVDVDCAFKLVLRSAASMTTSEATAQVTDQVCKLTRPRYKKARRFEGLAT